MQPNPKANRTVRNATELASSFVTTAETVVSWSNKSANASLSCPGTRSTILALSRRCNRRTRGSADPVFRLARF